MVRSTFSLSFGHGGSAEHGIQRHTGLVHPGVVLSASSHCSNFILFIFLFFYVFSLRVAEVAQWFRTLTALSEDPGFDS